MANGRPKYGQGVHSSELDPSRHPFEMLSLAEQLSPYPVVVRPEGLGFEEGLPSPVAHSPGEVSELIPRQEPAPSPYLSPENQQAAVELLRRYGPGTTVRTGAGMPLHVQPPTPDFAQYEIAKALQPGEAARMGPLQADIGPTQTSQQIADRQLAALEAGEELLVRPTAGQPAMPLPRESRSFLGTPMAEAKQSLAADIVAKANQQKSQTGQQQEDVLIEKAGTELLEAIKSGDSKTFMTRLKHIVRGFQARQ